MAITFTSKPEIKLVAGLPSIWAPAQVLSWITTNLVPWINSRSGLVLISSTEVSSNVASVEFTGGITSEFDRYLLTIDGLIPETDNTSLFLRVSEDSGATWASGASDYRWTNIIANESGAFASQQDAADSEIQLATAIGTGTGESANFTIEFSSPSSSSVRKVFKADSFLLSAAPTSSRYCATGVYVASSNAINGIQLSMSADDIASGTFCLYGLRK